ncbi:MAG: cbb3-type cytochrome c oxidase subunit II [Luteolibacter sp.]
MNLRSFIIGLSASFGIAWLAVIVIPYFKMRSLPAIQLTEEDDGQTGTFYPKRTGRVTDGARVYAENGCYLCHTQVVRPTYAGNDLYRADWGGLKDDAARGDTRRETNAFDFQYETFAHIGVARMGPDLSNVAHRVETIYAKDQDPAQWFYAHLYNPRYHPQLRSSFCPSFRFLFNEREIKGAGSLEALPFGGSDTTELVPTAEAKALVSYLMSLKKDQPVPAALNFAPAKKDG